MCVIEVAQLRSVNVNKSRTHRSHVNDVKTNNMLDVSMGAHP